MNTIMRLIAIDPGQSTGIAVITKVDKYYLNSLHTTRGAQLEFELYLFPPTIIVIESAAQNGSNEQIHLVEQVKCLCKDQAPNALIKVLSPGHWKALPKARGWKCPDAEDQHQKDAYNMARFYILKTQNEDIGELRK